MRYRVVLEYDSETGHYTATVPGLPGLMVDAKSEKEALRLAKEGIVFYLEEHSVSSRAGMKRPARTVQAKVVTVDV